MIYETLISNIDMANNISWTQLPVILYNITLQLKRTMVPEKVMIQGLNKFKATGHPNTVNMYFARFCKLHSWENENAVSFFYLMSELEYIVFKNMELLFTETIFQIKKKMLFIVTL